MARSNLDPKLEEAASKSAAVAAMLAGQHDDPTPRYRRIVFLVAGAMAAIGIAWAAASAIPGVRRPDAEKPHEVPQEIDRAHYLGPIETEASARGEETAPFSGFAVSVDSEPPGAVVTIGGVQRGEAPVLANLECAPGAKLEVVGELAGRRPARREIACRADTLVKLTLKLRE